MFNVNELSKFYLILKIYLFRIIYLKMICFQNVVIFVIVISLLVIAFCIVLYVSTSPYPTVWKETEEKLFLNAKTENIDEFPSINDKFTLNLSVIVPAYNENERLIPMLDECLEYLEKRRKLGFIYEIIVVSDGSTDNTVEVAQNYAKKYETVRVLELFKNRGKGGAVRLGIECARGSLILFADADGATKFSDLEKLEKSIVETVGYDYEENAEKVAEANAIVCGSRAHLKEDKTAKRSLFRLLLMHAFHFLVWSLCVRSVKDTQCGFKLFTRESAKTLFRALHVERWAFDVELLYLAHTLNIPITEVPVTWTEIAGSKIVPFWSWLQMGRDLGLIWLRYKIGAWKIATSAKFKAL